MGLRDLLRSMDIFSQTCRVIYGGNIVHMRCELIRNKYEAEYNISMMCVPSFHWVKRTRQSVKVEPTRFLLSNPLCDGNCCSQELIAESCASVAYAIVTLSSGADAACFLERMAHQADDHADVCCQVPNEALAADSTDTTMFGTTFLRSFSELVEHVPIDVVVKVVYKYK